MRSLILLLTLVVIVLPVGVSSLCWWYYPTLQDMRDTNHRNVRCDGLYEMEKLTVEEAEFVGKNCLRRITNPR